MCYKTAEKQHLDHFMPKFRKRDLNDFTPHKLYALLLLCGSILLICYAGCQKNVKRPLRLAIHPWVGYQTLCVSANNGDLNPELVEITRTDSISDSAQLLLKDGVDAAALTLDEVLSLREKGVPLSIVLVFNTSAGADLLISRPNIARLEELKNATIGMEDSVLGYLMLAKILQHADLERKDVRLHFGIVKQHETLWNNPEIDALITYMPLAENMRAGNILFDTRMIPEAIIDVLAVRTDRMEQFSAALKHIVEKHFAVADNLYPHAPKILGAMAICLNADTEETKKSLSNIIMPNVAQNHELLNPDQDSQLIQSAKDILEIMHPRMHFKPEQLENLSSIEYLPQPSE
jgi:NitT/TauT family transport system substrate-binding protein